MDEMKSEQTVDEFLKEIIEDSESRMRRVIRLIKSCEKKKDYKQLHELSNELTKLSMRHVIFKEIKF